MIEGPPGHLLVAGVTTRALATSAARAGYRVTAVDAFGDLDLSAVADVITINRDHGSRFSPQAAAAAGVRVPAGLVAYTSNFENYPDSVAHLSKHRRLLGNPPAVLRRVRDPLLLMRSFRSRGFATPGTRATPGPVARPQKPWLLKPRRSGGGYGTRPWRPGHSVPRSHYLQERIAGIPGSLVFAADGRHATPLGLTRQLVGDPRFGAHGFRYCGSIIGRLDSGLYYRQPALLDTVNSLAGAATAEFGLVGLNGLDFIGRRGVPFPVEINPRFSASMELLERSQNLSLFDIHARACAGVLPEIAAKYADFAGKAVVFARRDVTLGDTRPWLEDPWLADIPQPGETIRRHHPICTVFAAGGDAQACHRVLVQRAAAIYRAVELRKRGAA